MVKNTFDEGFNLELVQTAFFDGELEIPKIEPPKENIIPSRMIPYSKRARSKDCSECLVFYEHDINFADLVRNPENFTDDVLRFSAVVTPDNSLYTDAPLIVQIANVYRSRAIGHYLQKRAPMSLRTCAGEMSAAIRRRFCRRNSLSWGRRKTAS